MENRLREMLWNYGEAAANLKSFEQLVMTDAKLSAIEKTLWTLSIEASDETHRNLPLLIEDIREDLIRLGEFSAYIEDYIFTLTEPEEYERLKSTGYDIMSKHNI